VNGRQFLTNISIVQTPFTTGTTTTTTNGVSTTVSTVTIIPIVSGTTVGSAANSAVTNIIVVPGAAYGVWNAASVETISFVQRFDDYNTVGRFPIFENDSFRCYGLAGGRHVSLWERFAWRTTAISLGDAAPLTAIDVVVPVIVNGIAGSSTLSLPTTNGSQTFPLAALVQNQASTTGPQDIADYSNIVSNQMWGPVFGTGTDWWLGGGFSLNLDLRAALLVDVVKERAKYELADRSISAKRSRTDYTFVPELCANLNLVWLPIEGIELRAGYTVDTFFNTVSSPKPISFNYGALDPGYDKGTFRWLDGWNASIGFIF
jgi:hypothetical protein